MLSLHLITLASETFQCYVLCFHLLAGKIACVPNARTRLDRKTVGGV